MNVQVLWVADHTAFTVGEHAHGFYQLLFCTKEGGSVIINGHTYASEKNHIYLIKPSVIHAMDRGDDMGLIEIKFTVTDKETVQDLNALPETFTVSDGESLIRSISSEALSGNAFCGETADSALKIFLAHTFYELVRREPYSQQSSSIIRIAGKSDEDKVDSDILILGLKDYIEENLKREITLDELASRVFFNKTYFIKRFRLLWGTSPIKFINNMRIERATSLLAKNTYTVSYVAEECGFKSIHYFSRFFKKEVGISPCQYAKNCNGTTTVTGAKE